jgi:hypothetical protein
VKFKISSDDYSNAILQTRVCSFTVDIGLHVSQVHSLEHDYELNSKTLYLPEVNSSNVSDGPRQTDDVWPLCGGDQGSDPSL